MSQKIGTPTTSRQNASGSLLVHMSWLGKSEVEKAYATDDNSTDFTQELDSGGGGSERLSLWYIYQ